MARTLDVNRHASVEEVFSVNRTPFLASLVALCGLVFAAPVAAGPNAGAKILIHLAAPTTKNICTGSFAGPACSAMVVKGTLYPTTYFAYLLVAGGSASAGISGVQCGISYGPTIGVGVDVYSWSLCADLQFPSNDWPESGGGNLITWNPEVHCKRTEPGGGGTGVVAAAGYFYCAAYSPDNLSVTARPVDQCAKVVSCEAIEDILDSAAFHPTPSFLGHAAFSAGATTPGYNPWCQ